MEIERERAEETARRAVTVDSEDYQIVQLQRVGNNLVLKVKYPSCTRCTYEGQKVIVFLNVPEDQAMMWRRIDPHFRDPKTKSQFEAPSPAARFPASAEGWSDALAYATRKFQDVSGKR